MTEFHRRVLNAEGLGDWTVRETGGNEGFTHMMDKRIHIGRGTPNSLFLHEVAHAICGDKVYHYSEKFEAEYKRLKEIFG